MDKSINTSIPGFTVRIAEKEDVGLILEFIKELAAFEELLHEVTATEELLHEHLFGENPKAEVLIGVFKGKPVGFALFFHNFSTFLGKPGIYLEDLFVKPEQRGKGYGKVLLSCLADLAQQRKCGRLEWSVLDWNKRAISFYKNLGAIPMDEWTVFRVSGSSLNKLANEFEELKS